MIARRRQLKIITRDTFLPSLIYDDDIEADEADESAASELFVNLLLTLENFMKCYDGFCISQETYV